MSISNKSIPMTMGQIATENWYTIKSHNFGIHNEGIDYGAIMGPYGHTWYPSSSYSSLHADGVYMIISDTVSDFISAPGTEIATYHMASGSTQGAFVDLVNRLPALQSWIDTNGYITNFNDAKEVMKYQFPNLLMYETEIDKDHFNYLKPDKLYLNYDMGNMNSDLRIPSIDRIWNLSELGGLGFDLNINHSSSLFADRINASYRVFSNQSGSWLSSVSFMPPSLFGNTSNGSFLFNMAIKLTGNPNIGSQEILSVRDNNGFEYISLTTVGTTLVLKLDDSNNGSQQVSINGLDFATNGNGWNYIIFGYDGVNGFIGIANQYQLNGNTNQVALAFDNQGMQPTKCHFLDLTTGTDVALGCIQYWVDSNICKADSLPKFIEANNRWW